VTLLIEDPGGVPYESSVIPRWRTPGATKRRLHERRPGLVFSGEPV